MRFRQFNRNLTAVTDSGERRATGRRPYMDLSPFQKRVS